MSGAPNDRREYLRWSRNGLVLYVNGTRWALKFGRARGVLNADQVRVRTLLDRVIKRPNKYDYSIKLLLAYSFWSINQENDNSFVRFHRICSLFRVKALGNLNATRIVWANIEFLCTYRTYTFVITTSIQICKTCGGEFVTQQPNEFINVKSWFFFFLRAIDNRGREYDDKVLHSKLELLNVRLVTRAF